MGSQLFIRFSRPGEHILICQLSLKAMNITIPCLFAFLNLPELSMLLFDLMTREEAGLRIKPN